MIYTLLKTSEGPEYMQHVWGLTFKPVEDENFFVEQWQGHVQRAAAEFWGPRIMFFALDPKFLNVLAQRQELYAFGAFNQVDVVQMRARGTATETEDTAEISNLRERLLENIPQGRLYQSNEIERARELIQNGKPFCFCPEEYAYSGYERG